MKKLFLFLIVSVLCAQEMDWRTFQRNMQRTGFTPFKGDFSNGFTLSYHTQLYEIFSHIPPVIGNVDDDPFIEIVVICSGPSGIRVYNGNNGTLKWQYNFPDFHLGSVPVIEDINNDGINDIIFSATDGFYPNGGFVYPINSVTHDTFWCFKVPGDVFFASVGVGDLDGDGLKEILCPAGNHSLNHYWIYILNAEDGSIYHIFDSIFVRDTFLSASLLLPPRGAYPVIGDLNNDGADDIVGIKFSQSGRHLIAIDVKNKEVLWEKYNYRAHRIIIDDINCDGINEVITLWYKAGGIEGADTLFIRTFKGDNGELLWEYIHPGKPGAGGEDILSNSAATGNINYDPFKEIFVISQIDTIQYSDYFGMIFIFNREGTLLFKDTSWIWSDGSGEVFCGEGYGAPAICDIDNDGIIEVVYFSDPISIRAVKGINYEIQEYTLWPPLPYMGAKPCFQFANLDEDSLLELALLYWYQPDSQMIGDRAILCIYNTQVNTKERYKILLKNENKYIYNILGQKILKEKLKYLPSGIYFLPLEKKKYLKF